MQSSVGFLDVHLVAEDPLRWVVPARVVDKVEETQHRVTKDDSWEFFLEDSLVDRESFILVEGEVVGHSTLGDGVPVLVDSHLVLTANLVDLGTADAGQAADGERDAVAQLDVLRHDFVTNGLCSSLRADL